MENMDKVWQDYVKTRDPLLKDKLILKYSKIVKYVAGRLSVHIGQHVEYDDLISYGIFGLIDAIDKYDPDKGVKFETYASLRIRGEIIDNIRKMDWVPRTLRQKNKQLEQAYTKLETELGREPKELELAAELKIPVEEVKSLIKSASVLSLVSLDDYLDQNHEVSFDSSNSSSDSPEKQYSKKEVKETLIAAIDKLSEKEKKVITLYYFEELTLKEISSIMGVSESRISQIHSKAVMKLQTKLGKYKSILFTS